MYGLSFGGGKKNLRFGHFSTQQGLSQAGITAVLQDRYGFIWVGTQDGLNRYDGSSFKVFTNRGQVGDISDNYIYSMLEDSVGRLWIGTSRGLNQFVQETGLFEVSLVETMVALNSDGAIKAILEEKPGTLLIGMDGVGLLRYDITTGRIVLFGAQPDVPDSLNNNNIRCLVHSGNGKVWVGTERGLSLFDPISGKFNHSFTGNEDGSFSEKHIRSVMHDREGKLWVGTLSDGLYRLDCQSGQKTQFRHDPNDSMSSSSDFISDILQDQEGLIWIATDRGLNRWHPINEQFERYVHNPSDPASISANQVICLFQDHAQVMWTGTQSGLNYWDGGSGYFGSFGYDPGGPSELAVNYSAFAEDPDGSLWVGSYGGGLNRMDASKNLLQHFEFDEKDEKSLSDNRIGSLLVDRSGTLWVGTYFSGLNQLNRDKGQFQRFKHDPNDPGSLGGNSIVSILEDRYSNLWVASHRGGLHRFNYEKGSFQRVLNDPSNPNGFGNDRIFSLFSDNDGMLWVGTQGSGMKRLDPETGIITPFRHEKDNSASLTSDRIMAIFEDREGNLWVGTQDGGLNLWTASQRQVDYRVFEHPLRDNGLATGTIYSIFQCDRGYLWIGTNKSIMRFDPRDNQTLIFDSSYGLQEDFTYGAAFKTSRDEILYGGSQGFNYFFPDQIKINDQAPFVAITDVRLFDRPVNPGEAVDGNDSTRVVLSKPAFLSSEMTLNHLDRKLSFEFAALHFANPARNKLAYMLEGYEPDWVMTDQQKKFADYTNLAPGDYTFKVKASNNYGVWSKDTASIRIHILPPPWRTWWAYTLYFLILAGLALGIFYGQHRINRALEAKVVTRTAELKARSEELENLDRIVKTVNREVALEKVLETILEQGVKFLPQAETGTFIMQKRNSERFFAAATTGYCNSEVSYLEMSREVLVERYTRGSERLEEGVYLVRNPPRFGGVESSLPVPECMLTITIELGGVIEGFLVFSNFKNSQAFDQSELRKMARFREHAVSAVAKAHFLQELKEKNEEILRTQNQLVMQEKMVSLGTLTAGVAHELKNPLNFVNNFSRLSTELARELSDQLRCYKGRFLDEADYDEIAETVNQLVENGSLIHKHGSRANDIVHSMMQFSRNGRPERRLTDINQFVEEYLKLAVHGSSRYEDLDLEIETEYDPQVGVQEVVAQSLGRVLINLINNAQDVLVEKKKAIGVLFTPKVRIQTLLIQDSIQIRVRDNGPGIPKENRTRIFNPFFTTKTDDSNIGLGLSISYDIVVQEHNGRFEVETGEGEFTEFIITLPIVHHSQYFGQGELISLEKARMAS